MSDLPPTDSRQSGIHEGPRLVRTLGAVVEHACRADAVHKGELRFGDRVVVRTQNSVYSLWAMGGDTFAVSGGWFDKNHRVPVKMTVNGCTYGGSVIRHDVVAAPGLFLEFGNSVSTTRIRDVRVVRWGESSGEELPC